MELKVMLEKMIEALEDIESGRHNKLLLEELINISNLEIKNHWKTVLKLIEFHEHCKQSHSLPDICCPKMK